MRTKNAIPSLLVTPRPIRRLVCAAAAALALGGPGCGDVRAPVAEGADTAVSSAPRPAAVAGATAETHAALAGSHAAAVDDRGVPSLLVATAAQPAFPGATPEGAARHHLERHAAALAATSAALDGTETVDARPLGGGGHLVEIAQRVGGIEVWGARARVLLNADRSLAAIAGGLRASTAGARPDRFRLAPDAALAAALLDLYGVSFAAGDLVRAPAPADADPNEVRLALVAPGPVVLPEPARVRKVYLPSGPGADALVPAFLVELYASGADTVDSEAWRVFVGAADGRLLGRQDLQIHDAYDYRVWADANGDKRPADGPLKDFSPHPTGMPDGSAPALVPSAIVRMEGFNKNPMGAVDPWLPPNSSVSTGNNCDVYTDRAAPDGFGQGDFRAQTSAPGVFDYTYDFTQSPTSVNSQGMASMTMLFYTVNWLHDYWYDSGFNEAARNGQQDNFGRGGKGGDRLQIQAQDNVNGGQRNNSNMSTPSDGMAPKMQVFVWTGPSVSKITLTPPGSDVASSGAAFGPQAADVTAAVVLADDGNNPNSDACQALVNAQAVNGKIALIDRGTCTFKQKAANAQTAGAVGVIIADNVAANTPPALGDGQPNVTIRIPVMGITQAAGNALKTSLGKGAVTARLYRKAEPDEDGGLDNTVIAHEWGHYLHHRLADCALQQCSAMSEGWGDFVALHTMLRDGDNLDGAYPMAPYASRSLSPDAYFGLRRQPYSVDMSKDGLMFHHITNGAQLPNTPQAPTGGGNAEVHNAGEVWATAMWEVYVALQKAGKMNGLTFDAVRRKMADYVVGGLALTPADATFTEQRDAILTFIATRSKDDLAVVAQAFARRGLGSCAVSPARNSTTFMGVVESTDAKPRIDLGDVVLDDSIRSCDSDGVLDAGERGRLTITIANGGPVTMSGTQLTVKTATPGFSFTGPTTVMVPDIAALSSTTVSFEIAAASPLPSQGGLSIDVLATNPGTCEGQATRTVVARTNYDELPMSSATDDVEAAKLAWTPMGVPGDKVWTRIETGPLAHAIHGADWGSLSDTSLVSPPITVSANMPFSVAFEHRYSFEQGLDMGVQRNFDGAVVEISDDGGASWRDVIGYTNPGYGGTITTVSNNPLGNRNGYVKQNPAWPNRDKVTLNFGMNFAGKSILFRFRIGTDEAAGDAGWDIDNVQFQGVDSRPFTALADNRKACDPVAIPDMAGQPPAPDLAMKAGGDGGVVPGGDGGVASGGGDLGSSEPPLADHGCNCTIGRSGGGGGATRAAGPGLLAFALCALALARRRRPTR